LEDYSLKIRLKISISAIKRSSETAGTARDFYDAGKFFIFAINLPVDKIAPEG
jgi:hypothetical protein